VGRIVPSQVVDFIHRTFPQTETQRDSPAARWGLGIGQATSVMAIVEMVDNIPSELILLEGPDFATFHCEHGYTP
jgi:hypothetical protein